MLELTDYERKLLETANQPGQTKAMGGEWCWILPGALAVLMILNTLLGLVWPWWSGGVKHATDLTVNELGVYALLLLCSVMGYGHGRFTARAHSLIRKLHQQIQPVSAREDTQPRGPGEGEAP